MFCENCGEQLEEGTVFCQFCGARTTPTPNPALAQTFCSNCGGNLPEGTAFCPKCGARKASMLGLAQAPAPNPAPGPANKKPVLLWVGIGLGAAVILAVFFVFFFGDDMTDDAEERAYYDANVRTLEAVLTMIAANYGVQVSDINISQDGVLQSFGSAIPADVDIPAPAQMLLSAHGP